MLQAFATFLAAVVLLVYIIVLLYQNRDRMAALILRQPMPAARNEDSSKAGEAAHTFVRR